MHLNPGQEPLNVSSMTDAQVAALALPADGIQMKVSPVIETRYVGTKRLPPGPPPGLRRNPDGSHALQNVAIVRVSHETEVLAAQRLYKAALARSAVIGVVAALVVLILAAAFYWTRQRAVPPPTAITAPCLVTAVGSNMVACRHGTQMLTVSPGQFFPDGRYQLTSVDSMHHSFSTVRMTDRMAVVFQGSPPSPPSMELSKK